MAGIRGLEFEGLGSLLLATSGRGKIWEEAVQHRDPIFCASAEVQTGLEDKWSHLLLPSPFSLGRHQGPEVLLTQPSWSSATSALASSQHWRHTWQHNQGISSKNNTSSSFKKQKQNPVQQIGTQTSCPCLHTWILGDLIEIILDPT